MKESVGACLVSTRSAYFLVFIRLYTAVHKGLHTEQHLPLDLFELPDVKTLIPAHVDEHLHTSVELEQ